MESNCFGKIGMTRAGLSSEYKFTIAYFDKNIEIFLCSEFDGDGNEIETLPTKDELLEYEYTLKGFLENIDEIINHIREETFDYYKIIYAKYYEKNLLWKVFLKQI